MNPAFEPRHRDTGFFYEALASEYLQQQGLSLIETNFQSKMGEIDLIMKDKEKWGSPPQEVLVFVEVRYRQSQNFCTAEDTVDNSKQSRLTRTAKLYLQKKDLFDKIPCRFDVVTIHGNAASEGTQKQQKQQITWIQNAF